LGNKGEQYPDIRRRCNFRVGTGHLERRTLFTTRSGCLSEDERQVLTLNEATPSLILGTVCVTSAKTGNVRGHVNWFPVTATGQLRWNSFSTGIQDHDINIDLVTPLPNASTAMNSAFGEFGNARGYHTESYDWETVVRLREGGDSFWHRLRRALTDGKLAHELVDDRFAVATGLYGADGVHGFHAELHPVFAMAILIDSSRTTSGSVREQWAVMLRNLGSEGDCAEGTLPLLAQEVDNRSQEYIMDLGSWAGAGEPHVWLAPSWASDTSFVPQVYFEKRAADSNRHVLLSFIHPRPLPGDSDYTFLGTIFLDWPVAGAIPWRDRFNGWMPNVPHPPLNIARLRVRSADDSSALDANAPFLDRASPAGVAGERALASEGPSFLHYMHPRELAAGTKPLRSPMFPRAPRTPPWPLYNSVRSFCTPLARSDLLCHTAKRWILGVSDANALGVTSMASIYVFPHAVYREGEGFFANFVNLAGTFGYRFDARQDRFFSLIKHDSVQRQGARKDGVSVHFSPFISPNNFRISDAVIVTPFTRGDIGLSWLDGDHGRLIGGGGIGLEGQVSGQDLMLEVQRVAHGGGYASQWLFTLGLLHPFRD
jgi:hypothetical protein